MPPRKNEPPEAIRPALSGRMVSIDDLTTLPGNPRRGDIERIKASLIRFGQRYPSVVRGNVLLAGNHRLQAMRELGWTHVAVVDADDLTEAEAEAFALADNRASDGATYDLDLLEDALRRLDADLLEAASYSLDDLADLDAALDRLGSEPWAPLANGIKVSDIPRLHDPIANYTRKIEVPIYEPTGPAPAPASVYDTSATDALLAQIDTATDITDEERALLVAAAHRHTVFRYDQLAELYAHAGPEMKALMEQSVLVIIDWDQAVELGFVRLSQRLMELADADVALVELDPEDEGTEADDTDE